MAAAFDLQEAPLMLLQTDASLWRLPDGSISSTWLQRLIGDQLSASLWNHRFMVPHTCPRFSIIWLNYRLFIASPETQSHRPTQTSYSRSSSCAPRSVETRRPMEDCCGWIHGGLWSRQENMERLNQSSLGGGSCACDCVCMCECERARGRVWLQCRCQTVSVSLCVRKRVCVWVSVLLLLLSVVLSVSLSAWMHVSVCVSMCEPVFEHVRVSMGVWAT